MDKKPQKFIIDVAILTRLPLSRAQFFSYVYHEEIPTGSLVSVQLFRRMVQGIVLGSRSDFHRLGNFELKKVQSVLAENFLTETQIKLAEELSQYYLSPLGIILKQFVPKRVKARTQQTTNNIQQTTNNGQNAINNKQIVLTEGQGAAVFAIANPKNYNLQPKADPPRAEEPRTSNLTSETFLLYGPASCGKTEVYLEALERILKNDPTAQFLIMVPELTLAADIIQRVTSRFGEEKLAVLHSNVSGGAYYRDWERIRNGEASIVIGTRMAVFAPFKNLALIVVDEEQDISYKQWDMNPRYDARTAARMLSEIHKSTLVYVSATPRVETFYKAQTEKYKLLKLPKLELPSVASGELQIKIIDMRKERWTDFAGKKKPNYSCISRELESELHFVLSYRQQAILFINHQGINAFTVCAACKEVLRCPQCQRTLVYDEGGTYKCLHCSYDSGAFAKCEKCGSLQFRNMGTGTQTVEREVKKRFPAARVARADNRTMKNTRDQENLFAKFSKGEIDILVGTQMITKGWDVPNVSLVGIIDADSLMTIPDISTDERALQNIMQAAGRTARVGSKYPGHVIIQTFDPFNKVIEAAANMDYDSFSKKELEQRETLKYPPFGRFIRLICQNSDKNALEKEAKVAYNKIMMSLGAETNIRIVGPTFPLVSKVRTLHRMQILISIRDLETQLPKDILNQLYKLGSHWIIDVDPISII